MRKLRRILLYSVLVILVVLPFFRTSKPIKAISDQDIKTIGTNTVVEDVLEKGNNIKYYKFTVDKTGYINISFTIPEVNANVYDGWNLTLIDSDGNSEICSFEITTDRTLPKLAFKKGTELYIKVKDSGFNGVFRPYGVKYQLKVNTNEDANWEVEYNNSTTNATTINSNVTYCGNVMNGNDVDFYHFVVDQTGYFNVAFTIPEVGAYVGNGWYITIYVGDKQISSFSTTSNTTTRPYSFKQGTDIYIKIQSRDSYTIFTTYNLQVNATASSVWEQESNDSMADAFPISLGKTYSGTTYCGADVDYYKVTTTTKGFMTVELDPDNLVENLGYGYVLSAYDSENAKLASYTVKEKTSMKLYLNAGDYYIRVENYSSSDNPGGHNIYKLMATLKEAGKPGKASIKSAKGTTYRDWFCTYNNISYKINPVKNAYGYEVQICTSNKFKRKKTTVFSGNKGTIGKQLLRKKRYYIRARAYYETPLGNKTYGNWSGIKSVRIK